MTSVVFPGSALIPKKEMATTESLKDVTFDPGDIGFVLVSTALVWLMIPGLGFYYAGVVRAKNALSLILFCFWSVAVVSVQWFLFGYSLTFSSTANLVIGDFQHLFLQGVYNQASVASDKIPALAFCLYQGMFAAITPALMLGAGADRARFLPTTVFIFLWTSLVYDFLACWTWNPNGWAAQRGGLDFAGGTPVHISSGAGALAFALVLGRRERPLCACCSYFKPHNLGYTMLGTGLLWFGWFGFNGGSALAPNLQAVNACVTTNLSAAIGGLVWTLLEYFQTGKWSPLGFCSGAIAGLVCITPACGYVSPASSLVFGSVGAFICRLAVKLVEHSRLDDPVDAVTVHGVGGVVGCLLTGIFAQNKYASITGGWLDGNYMQMVVQLVDVVAGFAWSFGITMIILLVMNLVPPLRLRVSPEVERAGIDQGELGASAYEFHEELQSELKSQRDFGALWNRLGDTKLPFYYRCTGGEGRQFDYASQVQNFCESRK